MIRRLILRAVRHRCLPNEGGIAGAFRCWCGQQWRYVLVAGVGYRWMRAEQGVR